MIKTLELDSFGGFEDYKLELESGVNLIYGENESGKSTLHSFIDGMFYGFLKPFTKKTIYLEEHEKYNPINSNLYRGNLEFQIEDVVYRIERDFKKGNESTRIYEKATGEDITYRASDLSAGKVIQPGIYFFALSDLVFKNTVFISQQKIYTDDKLADEVRDRLVNVVSSKDESISVNKAIDILDFEFKEIGTQRAYTSKYGILFNQLSDKKTELKETEQKRSIYNDLVEKAETIHIKRESIKKEITQKEELLKQINLDKSMKKYNQALGLENKIKLLNDEIYSLSDCESIVVDDYFKAEYLSRDHIKLSDQIEDIKVEIEKIQSEKNSIDSFNESEIKDFETVIEDGFRVKYIEESVKKDSEMLLKEKIKKNEKSIKTIKMIVTLLSVLYLFLDFYFLWTKSFILLAITQFLLLVVVLLFYKLKLERNSAKPFNNNQNINRAIMIILNKYGLDSIEDFDVKVEYAEKKKEESDSKKADLIRLNDRSVIMKDNIIKLEEIALDNKKNLKSILSNNKQNNIEDFKKAKLGKIKFDELQRELSNFNKELSKLLQGKITADLKVDRTQIKDFKEQIKNLDQEKIQDELNSFKIDAENLSLDYRGCEVQIRNLEDDISKEASLNEEITSIESKIKHLDMKKSSIQYAINRIKKLSTEIHRDYAPLINEKVGQMVNNITGGRYKSVKIDKNLNISLILKDGKRLIEFNKLSAGTIDQIYFSLRMGLTQEIINKNLPIVLDECFSQYDDTRLAVILQVLIQKEEKRQIILFTCHNREKQILDKLGIEYNYINLQN